MQGDVQEATVVSVTDDGAVIDEPVENVLMRKSLKVRGNRAVPRSDGCAIPCAF